MNETPNEQIIKENSPEKTAKGSKPMKRKKKTLFNEMLTIFIVMTILVSLSSCLLGYIKYSTTIEELYNEKAYSIANTVKAEFNGTCGDFIDNVIAYKKDENGNYLLTDDGRKIPDVYENDGVYSCKLNIDIYADVNTLSEEEQKLYNQYYDMLDRLDSLRESSGAKYIFIVIPCDGDNENDPYYEVGQKQYDHPYAIYIADAMASKKTTEENASLYGIDVNEYGLIDSNGEINDEAYNSIMRLNLGMQTALDPLIYEDALDVFLTGEQSQNKFTTDTEFGKTTEALLPLSNSDNETVAMIAVDIEMSIIKSTIFSYVTTAIVATVALVSLFMIAFLVFMKKRIVEPIELMTEVTASYGKGNLEALNDLDTIKTGDEIENLSSSTKQMIIDITNYVKEISTVTAEKERIGAELNVATKIQASMLPCIFPPFPHHDEFDIFATMQPAKEVGGDFYDFFLIDEDHLAVVMADVSGKGVPAALFMVIAKTLIKNHAQAGEKPCDVFTNTNRQLCESNDAEMFVTAWMGVYELSTGKVTYVNAGHNPPLVKHKDGEFEYLKGRAGFVLAGFDGMIYKQAEFNLGVGDTLYLYTDGVTESNDINGDMYGEDRLKAVLDRNPGLSSEELLRAVKADIDLFVGEADQFDDITMLGLQIKCAGGTDQTFDTTTELESTQAVTDFVDEYLDKYDCPMKHKTQLCIAVDEIFSNISRYAYGSNIGKASITCRYDRETKDMYLIFVDGGMPYNPLEKEDPDVSLSAEDRTIGGLGIYMVKKLMDDVTYEYKNNKNILTLRKNLDK